MSELIVYSAADCSLCDDAIAQLKQIQKHLKFEFREVKIDGDEQLEATYRSEIPVGVLNGRKLFKYYVDVDLLARRFAVRTAR